MQSLESVPPIMPHVNVKSTSIKLIRAAYTSHRRSSIAHRNFETVQIIVQRITNRLIGDVHTYCVIYHSPDKRKRETKKNDDVNNIIMVIT